MKGLSFTRAAAEDPSSVLRKNRRTWARIIVILISSAGLAMLWQKAVSTPDALPPISQVVFDYPDSFALGSEYFTHFSIRRYTIQPNDTLSAVLQRFNLPVDCVPLWQESCKKFCQLGDLRPNDDLAIHVRRSDHQIVKFVYSTIDGSTYTFRKAGDAWECQKDRIPPIPVIETVKGVVTGNLYDSCIRAGLPASSIMELADLFAYDVDFAADLREGDTFAVHFQEEVKDGKRIRVGPILAAEMVVSGERYQAFYYKLPDGYEGYFDFDGKSLRTMFLKAPLSYSRISSTFTYKRLHPILKIYRPHLGIDYAAPPGTPVSSLGAGIISYIGRKGGFGNYIEVRHDQGYRTAYGHLASFAKQLHNGSKVDQGQVIGYVGSTGLATGPHLDFRFYKDDKPINFLKTAFPKAKTIPKSLYADFRAKREAYLAALQSPGGKRLAQIQSISQGGE